MAKVKKIPPFTVQRPRAHTQAAVPVKCTKIPSLKGEVGALHSSVKSGYAKDILGAEAATAGMAGRPVPPASATGRQEGVPTPDMRRYNTGKVELLDLGEAQSRMVARAKGTMGPMQGGLEDPKTLVGQQKGAAVITDTEMIDAEFPDAPEASGYDGMSPVAPGERMDQGESMVPTPRSQPPHVRDATQMVSKADQYLKQRKRVTLELSDSTTSMGIVDLIVSKYSVTLLLPITAEGGIVTPKVGSELSIVDGDKHYDVYFPGAQFEIGNLAILGMSFLRKDG